MDGSGVVRDGSLAWRIVDRKQLWMLCLSRKLRNELGDALPRNRMLPVWRHFCQHIERVTQRFPCAFQAIQITYGCQHMCRVGALASARFQPATTLAQVQYSLQQLRFGSSSEQACAKLREHRKIKVWIS